MGKSKQSDYFKTKALLRNLRGILDALPTDSDRQEIRTSFNALNEFLSMLQKNFEALPSTKDMSEVARAIEKLEELFAQAESNPLLGKILGLRPPTLGRPSKTLIKEELIASAKVALANLESLPIDEIRSKLLSEGSYSISLLRAIASVMGIRSVDKLKRDTLVHQIAMKIANYRGYVRLGGQVEEGQKS